MQRPCISFSGNLGEEVSTCSYHKKKCQRNPIKNFQEEVQHHLPLHHHTQDGHLRLKQKTNIILHHLDSRKRKQMTIQLI